MDVVWGNKVISAEEYKRRSRGGVIITETGQVEPREEWDFAAEPVIDYDDPDVAAERQRSLIGVRPSQFVEFAIKVPDKIQQKRLPFSFEKRRYLRLPYDTPSKRTLYKCGRQTEKCAQVSVIIRLFNGAPVRAGDVKVGDYLSSLSANASHMTYGRVAWVSDRFPKSCVRIKTRQGHSVDVALTHPMRTWDSWTEAGKISVGDRLAVVRRCGIFHQQWVPEKARIRLTAYLIGDGCIGGTNKQCISFTQMPGPVLNEFLTDVGLAGGTYRLTAREGNRALQATLHKDGNIWSWMAHDGLLGHLSGTKFVPYWIWGLSKEDTALFLNRLWATDGHVKQNTKSLYSLEYCSISERLIRDVQALLWKFGIPSSVRKNWPNYWKDQGIESYAYILRVETAGGVHRFLDEIACLGKSEKVEVPTVEENNNRDTYPIEINRLIKRILDSRGSAGRMGRYAEKGKSLRTAGLRETLKCPPSWQKLQQYVDYFKSDTRYDQRLVQELENHISTDLYWDEVEEITPLGEQECVDFEVEDTHNFVADGFVTHNSTLLGNKCMAYCCIINAFNVLYVSPTNLQTKTFSSDRLKEPMETSEYLGAWTTSKMSDSVFLKKFVNRSQITLRYAYHNADRVRGIAADLVLTDEIQDVITDNIPVIEECASHSNFKLFIYSGTPKSLDNALEKYWTEQSTQNEWVVPCERHTPWHWNILGEANIQKHGLSCERCGELIDATHEQAQWVSLNPDVAKKLKEPYEGYRIPQLMVPWLEWSEILDKQIKMPKATFMNEVLGLSFDSGTRPLTRQDVIDNCKPGLVMSPEVLRRVMDGLGSASPVFAGVDWGCYSEDTRTLTDKGFKYHWEIDEKQDKIAQYNPDTGEVSYVLARKKIVFDHDGEMLHFKAPGQDLLITLDHKIRYRIGGKKTSPWKEGEAQDVEGKDSVRFPKEGHWVGEDAASTVVLLRSLLKDKVGSTEGTNRVPREILGLSRSSLRHLFAALMLRDGAWDTKDPSHGSYLTTSEAMADDVLELAYKLGYRAEKSVHTEMQDGGGKQWVISISPRKEPIFHSRTGGIQRVRYKGKAYCFSVPSGYFVTERNGCIAQAGNTGENTYTVLSLGAYLDNFFTIFYIHRFEGPETEPTVQIDLIEQIIKNWRAVCVGTDYGGGYHQNDSLQRVFGRDRIFKYQYSQPNTKVRWEPELHRFLVHRTEVMSDIFNAIKRRNVFRFPDWNQFDQPFAQDFLNIFSEYNEQQRQIQYKKSPDCTDDSFHSVLLCFLASMLKIPRFDVLNPTAKTSVSAEAED